MWKRKNRSVLKSFILLRTVPYKINVINKHNEEHFFLNYIVFSSFCGDALRIFSFVFHIIASVDAAIKVST